MNKNLNQTLSERLTDVLLSGTWIAGTNWQDQLNKTDFNTAKKSYNELNSIATLCFHINYYITGLCHVLEGNPLNMSDKYSFDAPDLKQEAEWIARRNLFIKNSETFIEHIKRCNEEFLAGDFVNPQYGTWQKNIEGFIEHAWYHLGQVVLIRKLLS
ncbi:MAG: DUF1572 domain-containing protein [Bacteroidetes bacterium]|nr:DUF1572 domain-containing protein [Bacteroidota bacterium]